MAEKPQTVLDIACGTGIAARLFTARDCQVTGVEPDEHMAEIARQHGVQVEESTLEAWEPGERRFDLLTCGHAWHWLDPELAPAKAASVIRQGGRFAAFWNLYEHDPAVLDAFTSVYERHAPHLLSGSLALGTSKDLSKEQTDSLNAVGSFEEIEWRSYSWDRFSSSAQWIGELATHSDHSSLPQDQFAALVEDLRSTIEELGGRVVIHQRTVLLTARRG